MENTEEKKETIIEWASKRPVWEKYIWEKCLKHGAMTAEDFDGCYEIFLIENNLSKEQEDIPEISLDGLIPPQENSSLPIKLRTIKDCENVNAIPGDQEINFHDDLTIVYGLNGAGKSGFGRLLAEACFSRGKRNLLPNVKEASSDSEPKAKFIFDGGSEIVFSKGQTPDSRLRRFSVFDDKSVPIYLDGSNTLNFVPGELKTFDLVYECIQEIEGRFLADIESRKLENPSDLLFQSDTDTELSRFLLNLDANVASDELKKRILFEESDQAELDRIEKEKGLLQKSDAGIIRTENTDKITALNTYKSRFQSFVNQISKTRIEQINVHVDDYLGKKRLVEQIGAKQFDSDILKTVGSEKWRSLIVAAKELNEAEIKAGNDLKHCMLCKQELHEGERSLFDAYWEFLTSNAENEFAEARKELGRDLSFLKEAKKNIPTADTQNKAISIFESDSRNFAERLHKEIQKADKLLQDWIEKVNSVQKIEYYDFGAFRIDQIDELILQFESINSRLSNSFAETKALVDGGRQLKHLKKASNNQNKIITYHDSLIWLSNANNIVFPKNKYTTTRKRFFNEIITEDYTNLFNEESTTLNCPAGIKLVTKGKSGDTVLKLNLDYSNHSVSEILSEGEQKVTALADFLTEVRINKNNCGIIFDDPVTSLDHERKKAISKRLVGESKNRQVIIFTHDVVFVGMLVKNALDESVNFNSHWIKKGHDGTPGYISHNKNPKMTNVNSLKLDADSAVRGFEEMDAKEQERAIGAALDYLRSGCEALVQEILFAGTIRRYEDHIRVTNLLEVPFDKDIAKRIVDLHGEISEIGLMHNRSNDMRENTIGLDEFKVVKKKFLELEKDLKSAQKAAKTSRKEIEKEVKEKGQGWL